jgi:hypothetical protein
MRRKDEIKKEKNVPCLGFLGKNLRLIAARLVFFVVQVFVQK